MKPTSIILKPVNGSFAINKKAASPIVAVNVATTEPKEIFPLIYCVRTIIAPPQPGKAPKKEDKITSNLRFFCKATPISILKLFSRV